MTTLHPRLTVYSNRRLAKLLGVSERAINSWIAGPATRHPRTMPETARRMIELINRAPDTVVPILIECVNKNAEDE